MFYCLSLYNQNSNNVVFILHSLIPQAAIKEPLFIDFYWFAAAFLNCLFQYNILHSSTAKSWISSQIHVQIGLNDQPAVWWKEVSVKCWVVSDLLPDSIICKSDRPVAANSFWSEFTVGYKQLKQSLYCTAVCFQTESSLCPLAVCFYCIYFYETHQTNHI